MGEKLKQASYIWFSITFKEQTKALLNSKSEVNATSYALTHQLGLKIGMTNVGAQKIDRTILETYGMIVFIFSMLDKDSRERFFEENFLLANVKLDIVHKMLFLIVTNVDIDFQA